MVLKQRDRPIAGLMHSIGRFRLRQPSALAYYVT